MGNIKEAIEEHNNNPYLYPTLEEFKKELETARNGESEQGEDEVKRELVMDNITCRRCNQTMTDHTGQSAGEDEEAWIEEQTEEQLWEKMLDDALETHRENVCKNIPDKIVEKYMSKSELKQLKHMKHLKVVNQL